MTAAHSVAEAVQPDSTTGPPIVSRTIATKEALARLRGVSSNNELADRIPVELCQAGFGRVLFSLIQQNTWMVRSAHTTGDEALTAALLEAGRAHPRRLSRPLPESAMVRTKSPILVERPQTDPRVNSPLVAVVKPNVYVAAPVYMWQTPVALLHADAPDGEPGDVGAEDRDVLGVFAEGLGAIMERNIVLERMQSMRTGADEHRRLLESLIDSVGAGLPDDAQTAPPPIQLVTDDSTDQLTRRERQVLNLLTDGKTNAQIAGRLFISEGTVKSHLRHIMEKLGAANRTEAVARYRRGTLGHPPSGAET